MGGWMDGCCFIFILRLRYALILNYNLLLVQSHHAEKILLKRLIQERKNATRRESGVE